MQFIIKCLWSFYTCMFLNPPEAKNFLDKFALPCKGAFSPPLIIFFLFLDLNQTNLCYLDKYNYVCPNTLYKLLQRTLTVPSIICLYSTL